MKFKSVLWNAIALVVLIGVFAPAASAQTTETYTFTYAGQPLPVFVDEADVITFANLTVPRSIKIQNVVVTVDIEYPNPGDLNVYLYSAAGTRTKLVERNCGNEATLRRITFDDSAPNSFSDFCPAEPGRVVRGNEPLGNSREQNAAGVWRLAVENNGSNDAIGWLVGFSVTITGEVFLTPTTAPQLVVNAASLAGGGVAPGELVSIYGTNVGPATPVQAPKGDLPTTLGGTEVSINEQKAPILYASKYRVDVQIPYALGVPGDIWVSVLRDGQSSAPVNVPVVSTKPGLFSINPSGIGQLEAENADGTLNKNQAAVRGTEVTVFASGLGWTVPPVPAGQSPTTKPLAIAYYPVSARVGGIQATVGTVSLVLDRPGVYAVKIQVPTSIPVGLAEVVISSVSASSQDGAFIRVR